MRKRIAAIDYGDARIGLAVSDESHFLASPLKAIPTMRTMEETARAILTALDEKEPIEKIVLGLPLLLNGKESPSSTKVRELATWLEKHCDKTIVFWDERLTTAQVERTLKEAEMSRKKRTKYVDAMAAGAILQSYLDSPAVH